MGWETTQGNTPSMKSESTPGRSYIMVREEEPPPETTQTWILPPCGSPPIMSLTHNHNTEAKQEQPLDLQRFLLSGSSKETVQAWVMSTCHRVRPKCSITYQCPVPGLSQSFLFLLSPPKGKKQIFLNKNQKGHSLPPKQSPLVGVLSLSSHTTLAFSTPVLNFGPGCSDCSAHSLQPRKPLRRQWGGGYKKAAPVLCKVNKYWQTPFCPIALGNSHDRWSEIL